ncbi:hypothetical protein SAMN06297164_3524 [Nitrosomonas ureae]|uniref:Uncharacterized protein n=1 Tax=Nitrosomonas ureae TaxID=44577 RepID=A0A286AL26_9PROT|nr:hypothetical protein SAMN06297164_3524 [Nitrosomonas ureae]
MLLSWLMPVKESIKKWGVFFSNQAAIFNIDAGLSAFFSIFNPGYQRSKGSVAKNNQIGALLNFLRAFLDERFQMASLSGRYNLGLCPVVLQIRNQLSRSGGNDARTRV